MFYLHYCLENTTDYYCAVDTETNTAVGIMILKKHDKKIIKNPAFISETDTKKYNEFLETETNPECSDLEKDIFYNPNYVVIKLLIVHEDHRRKELFKRMFKKELRDNSYDKYILWTSTKADYQVYPRMGFQSVANKNIPENIPNKDVLVYVYTK